MFDNEIVINSKIPIIKTKVDSTINDQNLIDDFDFSIGSDSSEENIA